LWEPHPPAAGLPRRYVQCIPTRPVPSRSTRPRQGGAIGGTSQFRRPLEDMGRRTAAARVPWAQRLSATRPCGSLRHRVVVVTAVRRGWCSSRSSGSPASAAARGKHWLYYGDRLPWSRCKTVRAAVGVQRRAYGVAFKGWAAASGWLRSGLPAAASQHTVLPVVTTGVRGVTQLTGHRGERWSAIAYRTGLAAGMWRVCPARHTTNVRLPRPSVRVASSRSPGTTSTSPLTGGSYTRKAWRGL
jgi:hypothetical protein